MPRWITYGKLQVRRQWVRLPAEMYVLTFNWKKSEKYYYKTIPKKSLEIEIKPSNPLSKPGKTTLIMDVAVV